MLRQRNRHRIAVGVRYRHRDAPNATWEVIALYVGVDGKQHAVLSNISDLTWWKICRGDTARDGDPTGRLQRSQRGSCLNHRATVGSLAEVGRLGL
jgi:hypothetical protein